MVNYVFSVISDPSNIYGTYAYDINNYGQIIGNSIGVTGSGSVDTSHHGFVYDSGFYTNVDLGGIGTGTYPRGINDNGQIVGFLNVGYSFVYSNGTLTTDIWDPDAYGSTIALGINNSGDVVGSYYQGLHVLGFVKVGDTYDTLALGTWTEAIGINDADQIVGDYIDSTGQHGFIYDHGAWITLNMPGATGTVATGINNEGQVVGSYVGSNGTHSFIYSGGIYTTIDPPDSSISSRAFGINDAGQIVGFYVGAGGVRGFLATPVAVNNPPIASDIAGNISEDAELSLICTAVFSDLDSDDQFTFTIDTTGTIGEVTNNGDGTFSYDPDGNFEYLGVGDTATDTFTYTVTDSHDASSTATASVTIYGENDVPIALPDVAVVQKGKLVSGNVRTNDHDPDIHDLLYISSVNGSSTNVGHIIVGTYGKLTLNSDGSYSYLANTNIPSLTTLGGVQDHFSYTVTDGHGGTATSTLTVTVQTLAALNHAPVLSIAALDANKAEGNSGTTTFIFTVTRDGNASGTTTVDWTVGPGSGVTADGADFNGRAFPTGMVTFGPGELTKNVAVDVQGDTLYESNGKTENFLISLSNAAASTISTGHASAVGHIRNDDAPLQTAAAIFSKYGTDGEVVVLATLAEAAYHLVPGEVVGTGINTSNLSADNLYSNGLPAGLRLLTSNDLPSLSPQNVDDPQFPTKGLVDGLYLDSNAAALVVRSADSVFISFRGTNDLGHDPTRTEILDGIFGHGPSPDINDWGHMDAYYALLKPLITALDSYINDPSNGVQHVYVTGHSLGAAMAQEYLAEHPGAQYSAVTFANPGFQSLDAPVLPGSADDSRIINIHVEGDPAQDALPFTQIRGDDYIITGDETNGIGSFHEMELYYSVARFLNTTYSLPLRFVDGNGVADTVHVAGNIAWQSTVPHWQVNLPHGLYPAGTSGIDYIHSNVGTRDVMKGGSGPDTFAFSLGFGKDIITDFTPGEDHIQFDKAVFGNTKAILANIKDDGHGNTILTYDTRDTITLMDVTKAQLHPYDFLIA